MKSTRKSEWKELREAGCFAWVSKRGILGFGMPMGLLFASQAWIQSRFTQALIVFVPAVIIGGALFGLSTWHLSEWLYRRDSKNN
jgi:hypothetical protein